MAFADYTSQGAVAVITLANPPVNALGMGLRTELAAALDRAQRDAAIGAVVITGSGTTFSGGADVSEFNSFKAAVAPTLHDLIKQIEDSPKPVVAAINALALGGGLELALICH